MANKTYQQLRDIWYKKLAKTFDDIEDKDGNLKSFTYSQVKSHIHLWESNAHYYELASALLNEHEFESNRERIIWEYHSNGLSTRDITRLLKKVKIQTNRQTVWETISNLQQIMKKRYQVE